MSINTIQQTRLWNSPDKRSILVSSRVKCIFFVFSTCANPSCCLSSIRFQRTHCFHMRWSKVKRGSINHGQCWYEFANSGPLHYYSRNMPDETQLKFARIGAMAHKFYQTLKTQICREQEHHVLTWLAYKNADTALNVPDTGNYSVQWDCSQWNSLCTLIPVNRLKSESQIVTAQYHVQLCEPSLRPPWVLSLVVHSRDLWCGVSHSSVVAAAYRRIYRDDVWHTLHQILVKFTMNWWSAPKQNCHGFHYRWNTSEAP